MKIKKIKILVITLCILLIISVLWITGLIPQGIAKIYGTIYVNINFPKMGLVYKNIEWSESHASYIIYFIDKEKEQHGIIIGPKYFPVQFGQGIFGLKEEYKEKYE